MMKIKKFTVIASLVLLISVFCFYINSQKGLVFKDKITICISFSSLFATLGGAYLGAKISGDNSRKLVKRQLEISNIESKYDRNVELIELSNNLNCSIKKGLNSIDISILDIIKPEYNYYRKMNSVYCRLMQMSYAIGEYDRKRKKQYLNGNNISTIILKDIEKVTRNMEEVNELFKNIDSHIENKAESKWIKECNNNEEFYPNRLEIVKGDIGKYNYENDIYSFTYVYNGKKNQIDLKVNEAFDFGSKLRALLVIYKIKKCINNFNKNLRNVYFKNEQSLINYINKLYSEL